MSTLKNAPYHHGNLRQSLLRAGLAILEREGEGEDALGLRELARVVGVSPAAPYRHFASKEALIEALAVIGFQRFTAMMDTIASEEPDAPLQAMGRAYVRFARENANLFRLMFSPRLRRDNRPNLAMAAEAAFNTLRHAVGGNGDKAHLRALAAWAKVHGLAVLLLDGQIAIGDGEDTEKLIADILDSL